jgi:hypothetical protein
MAKKKTPFTVKGALTLFWNQYGSGQSRIITLEGKRAKTFWNRKKDGKDRQYLPLFGPVMNPKKKLIYFLESSPSRGILHQMDLKTKKAKVLWQGHKSKVRQGIFYPWSFADSMAFDGQKNVLYWAGRVKGRNPPTTFYRFDLNKKKPRPEMLPNFTISTGRQIGQSVVYEGVLYVSSMREGLYAYPLGQKNAKNNIIVKKNDFGTGNFRGPAFDGVRKKIYFAVGSTIYVAPLSFPHKAKKLLTLYCCQTLWGLGIDSKNNQLFITAKNLKGVGMRGANLYLKDLNDLNSPLQSLYFGSSSSASKNLIIDEGP